MKNLELDDQDLELLASEIHQFGYDAIEIPSSQVVTTLKQVLLQLENDDDDPYGPLIAALDSAQAHVNVGVQPVAYVLLRIVKDLGT